jgi:hypothetical protein
MATKILEVRGEKRKNETQNTKGRPRISKDNDRLETKMWRHWSVGSRYRGSHEKTDKGHLMLTIEWPTKKVAGGRLERPISRKLELGIVLTDWNEF